MDEIERIQSYLASKARNGEIDFTQDIFQSDPEGTIPDAGQEESSTISDTDSENVPADEQNRAERGGMIGPQEPPE